MATPLPSLVATQPEIEDVAVPNPTKSPSAAEPLATVPGTILNVSLSAALQTTLAQPGISAYAVYFDQHDNNEPVWTTLADGGKILDGGTTSVTLTETVDGTFEGLNGGKIYFLVQSQDPSAGVDLTTVITQESDINWGSAQTYDYRFDSFEVTLLNGPDDKGNLTSVNGFGMPMELSVNGQTAGYRISASEMFATIAEETGQTVATYGSGPLKSQPREAISPSTAVVEGDSAFAPSDWDAYIDQLKTTGNISIAGFFNGSADAAVGANGGIWHNAGFYSYTLEWDKDDDVFWLSPTDASQIKGHIQFTEADLANSIYSTLGNVGIYASKDGDPYQILDHAPITNSDGDVATMNTGENNQWGAVLVQFLTGFTAGYYASEGQPLNPGVTGTIDLDRNWNWDPTYAFGANLASDPPTFQDSYSRALFENSNSYGSGYSDSLMQHYAQGGPLLSMSDPATGRNVSSIDITLYDDDETPEGYEPPVIYNYTAAGPEGYVVPTALSTNSVGLNLANATVVAGDDTRISLDVFQGTTPTGAPIWQEIEFSPGEGESLWQNWTIVDDGGTFSANAAGGASIPGQLLITSFPGVQAGTYWFRLNIGEDDYAKTFNLYTEIGDNSQGFLNPLHSGQAGAIAIDGLATIAPAMPGGTPPETIQTFGINFMYSSTTTIAPDNLVYNTGANVPVPNAPVAGTVDAGTFDALAGQDNQASNTIDSTVSELAFSWVGGNDAAATRGWISGYTNKVGALNFAEINFDALSGPDVAPVHTSADLDGQWQTSPVALGNGQYSITMREYQSSDTALKTPIGQESDALTLTVKVAEEALAAWGGTELELAPAAGSTTSGNWVDLAVLDAPHEAGKVVVVHLVDRDGNLVDEDTFEAGAGVTLADATVATLGAHHLADGTTVLEGRQSVYLPSDLRLAFAILSGNDTLDRAPAVSVTADGDGTASISVAGFTLSAETDNSLSDDAMIAGAQRVTDAPFVYLEQGEHLLVEAAGSTEGDNRLAFVGVDVNTASGEWSVGGVAAGDAGFEQAVRANLDEGTMLRGGGEFACSLVWTVSGESGFYAPVLFTDDGQMLVAPEADGSAFRFLGDNTFAFDDELGGSDADFDYDDMMVRLSVLSDAEGPRVEGLERAPLLVEDRAVIAPDARFISAFADDDLFKDFGLTVSASAPGEATSLKIAGAAIFRGDSDGVLIDGGPASLRILEGGRLVRQRAPDGDDGAVLTVDAGDTPTHLRNDGVIKGAITLGEGDDVVAGTGLFGGPMMLGAGDDRLSVSGPFDLEAVSLGSGDDRFRAKGTGEAFVNGGAGDDILAGGAGDDVLLGRLGDDRLRGGAGDDTLAGNQGADTFVIDRFNGDDVVRDFERGVDIVDLRAFDLLPGATGRVAAAFEEARGGMILDLSDLGGEGTVFFRGMSALSDMSDFQL